MKPPVIRVATEPDRARALSVLALGFASDPFNRWLYPDPDRYIKVMPQMADAFGGRAFQHGSAHIADDGSGAALWLPPGVAFDRARLMEVVLGNISRTVALDLARVSAGMRSYQADAGDCWYLPLIAVDPIHQGRGIGSRLLLEALRRIDAEGAAAYLEASNPRNVTLYQRYGFEVMGTIQVGSSPPMLPMYRPPR